jgi:hypothetical protein
MTGMATLVKMLPTNCNIIFYNNRGKGNSDGWWVPRLWDFGTHEYKDVIGALDYAKTFNAPIVVYGTCAGTFSNTKALCSLSEEKIKDYNIRAHIMDSTVVNLPETIERIPTHQRRKDCWLIATLRTIFLWSLRYTIFPRFLMTSGDAAQLDAQELAKKHIPTLYVDCKKGDLLTPHETTDAFYQKLLQNMSNDTEVCKRVLFKKSSHANHVLTEKKATAFALANFMNQHLRSKL